MYTPQPFKPDRAASLAFAEARGFGLACAWDGGKPVASALPFYLSYAADGTPLDFEYLHYRGDAFQYRLRIDPHAGSAPERHKTRRKR
mgnify:CR=1 FL=1